MSDEYGRLEMVKLSVRVFRLYPIAAVREGDRWLSLRADLEPHQSSIFFVFGCLPVALPPTKSKPVLSVQLLLPHLQLTPAVLAERFLHTSPLSIPVTAQVLSSLTWTDTPAASLDALTKGCSLHRTLEEALNKKYSSTGGSDSKESACNAGDFGSISGLGRFPGEGNSYPLQYSGLENSMNRGA